MPAYRLTGEVAEGVSRGPWRRREEGDDSCDGSDSEDLHADCSTIGRERFAGPGMPGPGRFEGRTSRTEAPAGTKQGDGGSRPHRASVARLAALLADA